MDTNTNNNTTSSYNIKNSNRAIQHSNQDDDAANMHNPSIGGQYVSTTTRDINGRMFSQTNNGTAIETSLPMYATSLLPSTIITASTPRSSILQQPPPSPNSTNPTPKQGNRLIIPSNDIVSLLESSASFNITDNTTNDNNSRQEQQQQQYSGRKLQLPVLQTGAANTAKSNHRPNRAIISRTSENSDVSVPAEEDLSRRILSSSPRRNYVVGGFVGHAHTIGASSSSSYTGLWNMANSNHNIVTDTSSTYNTVNNNNHPVVRLKSNYSNTANNNQNNRIRPRIHSPMQQQPTLNPAATNLRQFFLPTAPFIVSSQNPTYTTINNRVYEYPNQYQHQPHQNHYQKQDPYDPSTTPSRTNPVTINRTRTIPSTGPVRSNPSGIESQSQTLPPPPESIPIPRTVPLKPISQCPLFACFYAEFDIIVGPKIINEFPSDFMEQDIRIGTNQIETILQRTIESIIEKQTKQQQERERKQQQTLSNEELDGSDESSDGSDSQNKSCTLQAIESSVDDKIKDGRSNGLVVPDLGAQISSNKETTTATTNPITEPQTKLPAKTSILSQNQENGERMRDTTGTPVIQPKTPTPFPGDNSTNSSDTNVLSPPQLISPSSSLTTPAGSPLIFPRGMPPTKRDSTISSTSSTNSSSNKTLKTSNMTVVPDSTTTTTSTRRAHRHKKTLSATDTILEQLKSSGNGTTTTTKKGSDGVKPATNSSHPQQLNNSGTSIGTSIHHNLNNNIHSNDGHQSIFDSCSEYIITGNELSENIVNLSTHNIHVLTRPTSIHDVKYERNCLSFCVGFILRRSADSRPFRTILSKLALLLRDMEIENQFLTKSKQTTTTKTSTVTTNTQQATGTSTKLEPNHAWTWTQKPSNIQELLEQIFLALNSQQGECNLVLHCGGSTFNCNIPNPGRVNTTNGVNPNPTSANMNTSSSRSSSNSIGDNVLNLKLFHPPGILAEPVKDYAVPILLRRDWQLQAYDWDLSINWVSLHIDGIINARQISQKAEVDMEMVRACLRVLKHHGVIAFVDMFFYSNRYESTEKAATLLNGTNEKLLHEAVRFIYKGGPNKASYQNHQIQQTSPMMHSSTSPILTMSLMHNVALAHHYNYGSPSTPIPYDGSSNHEQNQPGSDSNSTTNNGNNTQLSSSLRMNNHLSASQQSNREISELAKVRKDYNEVKFAIAELYCACNRGLSIGDLLLALIKSNAEKVRTNHVKMTAITNWKKVCRLIDHRRFTTFGQVHGLLKRVHNFPLLIDTNVSDDSQPRDQSDDFVDNDVQTFTLSRANSLILDKNWTRKHRSGQGKSSRSLSGGNNNNNNDYRFYREKEELRALIAQIGEWMDGTHCDDELVCSLQKPLSRLFEMVRDNNKKQIVSLYATAS